jgi:hypothetical protein
MKMHMPSIMELDTQHSGKSLACSGVSTSGVVNNNKTKGAGIKDNLKQILEALRGRLPPVRLIKPSLSAIVYAGTWSSLLTETVGSVVTRRH